MSTLPKARLLAVVDDDPHVRVSLQRLLEPEGYEIMTFSSGQSLLQLLQGQLPDCLIMDVRMPGPNGFETVALLRQLGHDPQIVFLSGDDPETILEQYPEAQSKILSKPLHSQQLITALHAALQASTESTPTLS